MSKKKKSNNNIKKSNNNIKKSNSSVKKINTLDEDFIDVDVSSKEDEVIEVVDADDFLDEEEIVYSEGELDSSFIEGKLSSKKVDSNSDTVVVFNDDISVKYRVKSIIMYVLIALLLGVLIYLYFNPNEVEVIKNKYIVDENIVFLGDSITEDYEVDEYFEDSNVVNSGVSGNKTDDILDDMEDRVYRYNPSKVFLNMGINDLDSKDADVLDIYNNIVEIFEGIKENRELSELYFISIYPINDSDDDKIDHGMVNWRNPELVSEVNEKVKEYCEKNDIVYIDLYSKMVDSEGLLKLDYTTEGLHISDEGYDLITDELIKYIKK